MSKYLKNMSHKLFDVFTKIMNWNNSSENQNLNHSVPLEPRLRLHNQPNYKDLRNCNTDDIINNTKSLEHQKREIERQSTQVDKRADEKMIEDFNQKNY